MHHYVLDVAHTLGDQGLWQQGVPKLCFQYPCNLSLLLALSAYHLAGQQPDRARVLIEVAEKHSVESLQNVGFYLDSMKKEDIPALYIFSVLLCFTTMAKGPEPGNLLIVAKKGQVPWLKLLRGVRLIVSTAGWSSIFSGPLEPYALKEDEETNSKKQQEDNTMDQCAKGEEDWRQSWNLVLKDLDCLNDIRVKAACVHEIEVLLGCFEATFGCEQNADINAEGQPQVIFSWLYGVEDDFIESLHGNNPTSLVILAHFCVLLKTIDHYWFVQGWPQHILDELQKVGALSVTALAWPLKIMGASSTAVFV